MKEGGRRHHTIVRQLADGQGQAAAEYAVLLGLVAGVLIVAYQLFGEQVGTLYDRVLTAFT